FVEVGGDSLSAMRLIAAVNTGLDADLSVRAVFDSPTVAQLAPRIGKDAGRLEPLVAVERPAVVPLSFAQQRLWFLDQLQGASPGYNMAAAVRPRGRPGARAVGGAVAGGLGGRRGGRGWARGWAARRACAQCLWGPRGYPSSWSFLPSEPIWVGRSSMPSAGRLAGWARPSTLRRVTRLTWAPRSRCGQHFS